MSVALYGEFTYTPILSITVELAKVKVSLIELRAVQRY